MGEAETIFLRLFFIVDKNKNNENNVILAVLAGFGVGTPVGTLENNLVKCTIYVDCSRKYEWILENSSRFQKIA
jgi:hypothetical protein